MKYFFVLVIKIYQVIFSPILKTMLGMNNFCRFSPSCSEYAKQSILKYGLIKGSWFSVLRILRCQPFSFRSKKYGNAFS